MISLNLREATFALMLEDQPREMAISDFIERSPEEITRRQARVTINALIQKGIILVSYIPGKKSLYTLKKCAEALLRPFINTFKSLKNPFNRADNSFCYSDQQRKDSGSLNAGFHEKQKDDQGIRSSLSLEQSGISKVFSRENQLKEIRDSELRGNPETMELIKTFDEYCRRYYQKAGANQVPDQQKVSVMIRVKTEEAFKGVCEEKWSQLLPVKDIKFLPKPSAFWCEDSPCSYLDYFKPEAKETPEERVEDRFPRLTAPSKPVRSTNSIEERRIEKEEKLSVSIAPISPIERVEVNEKDEQEGEEIFSSLDSLFEVEEEKRKESEYIEKHIRLANIRLTRKYDFSIFKSDEFYAFAMNPKTGDFATFDRLKAIQENREDAWDNLFHTIENNGYGMMKMIYRFDTQKRLGKPIDMNPKEKFELTDCTETSSVCSN